MRKFAQLSNEYTLQRSYSSELWTVYFWGDAPYSRCEWDWGASHVYHFNRSCSLREWMTLVEEMSAWIRAQPALDSVYLVPFYEVGKDFVVQCKPPYDGGYSTSSYAEFLEVGECQPAPWFLGQLAQMHEAAWEAIRQLEGRVGKDRLPTALHSMLIRPNSSMFWADNDGWSLYIPEVGLECLRMA